MQTAERTWWEERVDQGRCPTCEPGSPEPGMVRCPRCLKLGAKAARRWRTSHRAKNNAYMRAYMRAYRNKRKPAKPAPVSTQQGYAAAPDRAWLLARIAALTNAPAQG